jgi:xanthine/CO dehydrogenase XdhC/CoxF family maturation factor
MPRTPPGPTRMPVGAPTFVKYGITADEAHRFGLPCGGTLELLLEYDPPRRRAGATGAGAGGRAADAAHACRWPTGSVTLAQAARPEALRCRRTELVNMFGPEYRMLLIGAGQLTEYLATMALFSGFAVTVCDPREEYRGAWSVRRRHGGQRHARRRGASRSSRTGAAAWSHSRMTPSSTTWRCSKPSRPTPSMSARSGHGATTRPGASA